jgi:hypothetical protein
MGDFIVDSSSSAVGWQSHSISKRKIQIGSNSLHLFEAPSNLEVTECFSHHFVTLIPSGDGTFDTQTSPFQDAGLM